MYNFLNDYSEGAHPNILRALETINYHQNNSYGLDEHSQAARDLIQEALEDYSVDIHFIAGGTLTNLTFLSHVLKPVSYTHLDVYKRQFWIFGINSSAPTKSAPAA